MWGDMGGRHARGRVAWWREEPAPEGWDRAWENGRWWQWEAVDGDAVRPWTEHGPLGRI